MRRILIWCGVSVRALLLFTVIWPLLAMVLVPQVDTKVVKSVRSKEGLYELRMTTRDVGATAATSYVLDLIEVKSGKEADCGLVSKIGGVQDLQVSFVGTRAVIWFPKQVQLFVDGNPRAHSGQLECTFFSQK